MTMQALTLPEIRAKYQHKLNPPRGSESTPYSTLGASKAPAPKPAPRQVREPPAVMSMTAETILAARARCGNWNDVARDLDCTDWDLRMRRRELGLKVSPKSRVAETELRAAIEQHGGVEQAARALGLSSGGSLRRRVRRMEER